MHLLQEPLRADFIKLTLTLGARMRIGILRLERLAGATRARFERKHASAAWFANWQAMPKAEAAADDDSD